MYIIEFVIIYSYVDVFSVHCRYKKMLNEFFGALLAKEGHQVCMIYFCVTVASVSVYASWIRNVTVMSQSLLFFYSFITHKLSFSDQLPRLFRKMAVKLVCISERAYVLIYAVFAKPVSFFVVD